MKADQRLLDAYGNEVFMFPMQTCNITQGDNVGTHLGTCAVDLAGWGTDIDYAYAPCTLRVVAIDSSVNGGNALFAQSLYDVHRACDHEGVTGPISLMMIHNNGVEFNVGDIIPQGAYLYREGVAGKANGNHIHFEVSTYPFDHMYDVNEFGVYHLPNNCPFEYVCYMNDTEMINAVGDFKYYEEPSKPVLGLANAYTGGISENSACLYLDLINPSMVDAILFYIDNRNSDGYTIKGYDGYSSIRYLGLNPGTEYTLHAWIIGVNGESIETEKFVIKTNGSKTCDHTDYDKIKYENVELKKENEELKNKINSAANALK